MDFRIYHSINVFAAQHSWLPHILGGIEKISIPLVVVACVGLWLLAPPGGSRRWKLAAVSGLAAAALALIGDVVISHLWERPRPFAAHPGSHVWIHHSVDSSFPSDHASAAFAIAVSVLLLSRRLGLLYVAGAVVIAVGRVVVGVHYLTDVLAGAAIGLAAALLVAFIARPGLLRLVLLVERLTDPVVARVRAVLPVPRAA